MEAKFRSVHGFRSKIIAAFVACLMLVGNLQLTVFASNTTFTVSSQGRYKELPASICGNWTIKMYSDVFTKKPGDTVELKKEFINNRTEVGWSTEGYTSKFRNSDTSALEISVPGDDGLTYLFYGEMKEGHKNYDSFYAVNWISNGRGSGTWEYIYGVWVPDSSDNVFGGYWRDTMPGETGEKVVLAYYNGADSGTTKIGIDEKGLAWISRKFEPTLIVEKMIVSPTPGTPIYPDDMVTFQIKITNTSTFNIKLTSLNDILNLDKTQIFSNNYNGSLPTLTAKGTANSSFTVTAATWANTLSWKAKEGNEFVNTATVKGEATFQGITKKLTESGSVTGKITTVKNGTIQWVKKAFTPSCFLDNNKFKKELENINFTLILTPVAPTTGNPIKITFNASGSNQVEIPAGKYKLSEDMGTQSAYFKLDGLNVSGASNYDSKDKILTVGKGDKIKITVTNEIKSEEITVTKNLVDVNGYGLTLDEVGENPSFKMQLMYKNTEFGKSFELNAFDNPKTSREVENVAKITIPSILKGQFTLNETITNSQKSEGYELDKIQYSNGCITVTNKLKTGSIVVTKTLYNLNEQKIKNDVEFGFTVYDKDPSKMKESEFEKHVVYRGYVTSNSPVTVDGLRYGKSYWVVEDSSVEDGGRYTIVNGESGKIELSAKKPCANVKLANMDNMSDAKIVVSKEIFEYVPQYDAVNGKPILDEQGNQVMIKNSVDDQYSSFEVALFIVDELDGVTNFTQVGEPQTLTKGSPVTFEGLIAGVTYAIAETDNGDSSSTDYMGNGTLTDGYYVLPEIINDEVINVTVNNNFITDKFGSVTISKAAIEQAEGTYMPAPHRGFSFYLVGYTWADPDNEVTIGPLNVRPGESKTFRKVPYGTYTLVEAVPTGYGEYAVTLDGDQFTPGEDTFVIDEEISEFGFDVVNTPLELGKIELTKNLVGETNFGEGGITFDFQLQVLKGRHWVNAKNIDGEDYILSVLFTENGEQTVTFENLLPGIYRVRELDTPFRYTVSNVDTHARVRFESVAEMIITNTVKTGTAIIWKYAALTSDPLPPVEPQISPYATAPLPLNGAVFQLQKWNGEDWEVYDEGTTACITTLFNEDEAYDGLLQFTGLTEGIYRFVEISPPPGFVINDSYNEESLAEFVIDANNEEALFFYKPFRNDFAVPEITVDKQLWQNGALVYPSDPEDEDSVRLIQSNVAFEGHITVTNTGNTPLFNLLLTDLFGPNEEDADRAEEVSTATGVMVDGEGNILKDDEGGDITFNGTLLPGESVMFTVSFSGIAAGATHYDRATVTAEYEGVEGNVELDPVWDDVSAQAVRSAGISVTKLINGVTTSEANPLRIDENETMTFTFTVRNTGSYTLYNVTVTDNVLGNIGTIESLPAGGSRTFTRTLEAPAMDVYHRNTVTATGTYYQDLTETQGTVTARASAVALGTGTVIPTPTPGGPTYIPPYTPAYTPPVTVAGETIEPLAPVVPVVPQVPQTEIVVEQPEPEAVVEIITEEPEPEAKVNPQTGDNFAAVTFTAVMLNLIGLTAITLLLKKKENEA